MQFHIGVDKFCTHITVTEHKTGKVRTIALNKQALYALRLYFPHRKGAFIFASNRKGDKAISRVQAWRIIHGAVVALEIVGKIACHSLRKTSGYHTCVAGKVSPAIVMEIYRHSSYAVTRRYLGIRQDELDEVYLGLAEKTHVGTGTEGSGKRAQANEPAGGWSSWPG